MTHPSPSSFTIVVGEKFAEYSRSQSNALTVAELERLVWSQPSSCPEEVILGQGVEYGKLAPLLASEKRIGRKSPAILNIEQVLDQHNLLHQDSVHKQSRNNVLITSPRMIGDSEYRALLAIQDSSELLSDHMTGQHIQGMVLVEAARQAMLSVSENFLLDVRLRGRSYFVLNHVSSRFLQFGFPLPTTIDCLVLSSETSKSGSLKGEIECRFKQNDTCIAEISIQFAAYDKQYIAEKEHSLAQSATVTHLSVPTAAFVPHEAH